MRTIAIGDLHGCLVALKAILKAINPTESDTLVFLGDYIDRGPNSKGVIQHLIDLSESHNIVKLTGNHELMLMRAYGGKDDMNYWLRFGGLSTLASYGFTRTVGSINGDDIADTIPRDHITFIMDCEGYHETDDHIFVHAGYDWDAPMDKQTENASFWNHLSELNPPPPHVSGKTFWVGHTAQKSHEVLDLGHVLCLDTWCWGGGGWLTAMDVDSREVWQVDHKGELRG